MKYWNKLVEKLGAKRSWLLCYLALIGIFVLYNHLLISKKLYHSALLYVLIPYFISVAITLFRPKSDSGSLLGRYFNHILTALSIFLSTSILIGEGFICILFFAPIYLIFVSIAYINRYILNKKNNKYSIVLPALIILMSMEGVAPSLSLPRHSSVEVTQSTNLSVKEIKDNLAKEFTLDKKRHWLLSIFPMPYQIEAGSLKVGDIHTVYTRYHRWFVANTHEGKAELLIEEVGANHVKTRVLSDTSYFSTYLNGTGTEIKLEPNADGGTDIKLKLNYRRNLDPAWYFHPLQKYGVEKMGELIIKELMIRA